MSRDNVITEYNLPECAMVEINQFLESKEAYLQDKTTHNRRRMYLDYQHAYTSVKHLSVVGIISRNEMSVIVKKLKALPDAGQEDMD